MGDVEEGEEGEEGGEFSYNGGEVLAPTLEVSEGRRTDPGRRAGVQTSDYYHIWTLFLK